MDIRLLTKPTQHVVVQGTFSEGVTALSVILQGTVLRSLIILIIYMIYFFIVSSPLKLGVVVFRIWTKREVMKKFLRIWGVS